MATPDPKRNGISLQISRNGIFCFVTNKKPARSRAARIARYNANSPEDTAIFLTKGPNVPNTIIDIISMTLGFLSILIIIAPQISLLSLVIIPHNTTFVSYFYFSTLYFCETPICQESLTFSLLQYRQWTLTIKPSQCTDMQRRS